MSKHSHRVFAHPRVLPKFFDDTQLTRLLAAVPEGDHPILVRDRAILELLVATGLRASELCALQVGDVGEAYLFVRCGKGGRQRYVPMARRAWDAVSRLVPRGAAPGDALFVNAIDGQCLTRRGLHKIVKHYLRAAGLKGSTHTIRHAAATHWLNRGMNIRAVQVMLGHSSLATTSVYLSLALDGLVRDFRSNVDTDPPGLAVPRVA